MCGDPVDCLKEKKIKYELKQEYTHMFRFIISHISTLSQSFCTHSSNEIFLNMIQTRTEH